MIRITLPDGSVKEVENGTTVLDVARSIGAGLAKAALAGRFDGKLVDLRTPLKKDGKLEIVTDRDEEAEEVIRHSAEHVMADAVKRLWPEVQIDVGRTDHKEKFQYDFKISRPFTPEDLEKIEKKMEEILAEKADFKREIVSREEAKKRLLNMGEMLKISRLDDIPQGEDISFFSHGEFVDLCRGPHVQNSSQIGAVKILDSSASYFRGNEENEVLQRVYGTAFRNKKALAQYLERIEEAKKRDHRKIGKELDLFSISESVGPGLILWHPKGALVRSIIEDFWRKEHLKAGYDLVYSPHLARRDLWDTSGHTSFYKENMYSPMEVEEQKYMVKPMNCPFHIQIYQSKLRSYRDLPLRYAELGTVYRYERSGVLHGLLRVRGFTQDDAHHFCTPDQLLEEIEKTLRFVIFMFQTFGFHEYEIFLSTRPKESVGTDEEWEQATQALMQALENIGLSYKTDPGEGVFYGPKIDIKVKDSIGRAWQCSTIQADFNLPARFDLEFVDRDGSKRRPIMVHRALLGSIERFFGCLVEHYAGAFPLWLAPVQVVVFPITDEQLSYAKEIQDRLMRAGFRAELDGRSETLGFKVREAQNAKVPYMIVIGAQEVEGGSITIRRRSGEKDSNRKFESFLEEISTEDEKHL